VTHGPLPRHLGVSNAAHNRDAFANLSCRKVRNGSKTEVPGFARHVRFTLRCRHRQPAPACPFGARADKLRVAAVKFDAHFLVLLSQWKFSNEVLLLQRNLVKSHPILRHQIEKFARGTF
jgi:hypothetical protein